MFELYHQELNWRRPLIWLPTYYCAAIATGVLLALDLPHPSNVSTEARRVLFTFIGVGIAVIVMLLADLLAKRAAKPSPASASQPA